MDFEIKEYKDWLVISVENRMDSFNYKTITEAVDQAVQAGQMKLALNLSRAEFLSLPSIKFFSDLAKELDQKGGELAFCAPSEKIKRQVYIFTSPKAIHFYRSTDELYN